MNQLNEEWNSLSETWYWNYSKLIIEQKNKIWIRIENERMWEQTNKIAIVSARE